MLPSMSQFFFLFTVVVRGGCQLAAAALMMARQYQGKQILVDNFGAGPLAAHKRKQVSREGGAVRS